MNQTTTFGDGRKPKKPTNKTPSYRVPLFRTTSTKWQDCHMESAANVTLS